MYLPSRSTRQDFQAIIERKASSVQEWIHENTDRTELYRIIPEPNGLGLRVDFYSIRAKALLLKLHKDVFTPGFAEPNPSVDESGVWSARWYYSEPWNMSPNYIVVHPQRPTL